MFVDKALPFGLRSAPLIFSAVADALQFMMIQNGATFVNHYVDDFITVGAPGPWSVLTMPKLCITPMRWQAHLLKKRNQKGSHNPPILRDRN